MQFRVTLPAVSVLLPKGTTLHGIAARTGDRELHAPVLERNNEILQCILKAGANIEVLNKYSNTPLYRAVERNNGDAAQLLFEYGAIAEPPQIQSGANNILHHALFHSAGELVPLLLEHGAKVEAKTDHAMTPFLKATRCGSVVALEVLNAAPCDIHARDDMQRTVLHHAAVGHTDAVKALSRLGSNPNTRDAEGKTPLHLTPVSHMSKVYELLVRHARDDKAVDHEGHPVYYYQNQSYNANYG